MRYQQVKGASPMATGLAGAEAPEPPSRLGPADGIPSAVLLNLAERCEKVAGRDRELDFAIYEACVGCLHEPVVQLAELSNGELDAIPVCKKCGTKGVYRTFKMFTSSLDAAMTLASGYGGEVTFFKDGTAKAYLWQPYPMAVEAKAASSALALCAAALKARAASGTSGSAQDRNGLDPKGAGPTVATSDGDAPKDPS